MNLPVDNRQLDALVVEHITGDSTGLQIPRYATDPAALKQLRDKMREDGWIVLMGGPEAKVPKFWCQVRATYRKNTKGIFHRESDTEELAGALAALAAVGHPIELQEQDKRNP